MSANAFFGDSDVSSDSPTYVARAFTLGGGFWDCLGQFCAKWPDWPQHIQRPKLMHCWCSAFVKWPSGPRMFVDGTRGEVEDCGGLWNTGTLAWSFDCLSKAGDLSLGRFLGRSVWYIRWRWSCKVWANCCLFFSSWTRFQWLLSILRTACLYPSNVERSSWLKQSSSLILAGIASLTTFYREQSSHQILFWYLANCIK